LYFFGYQTNFLIGRCPRLRIGTDQIESHMLFQKLLSRNLFPLLTKASNDWERSLPINHHPSFLCNLFFFGSHLSRLYPFEVFHWIDLTHLFVILSDWISSAQILACHFLNPAFHKSCSGCQKHPLVLSACILVDIASSLSPPIDR
jgi:hypothetical protein